MQPKIFNHGQRIFEHGQKIFEHGQKIFEHGQKIFELADGLGNRFKLSMQFCLPLNLGGFWLMERK